MKTYLFIDMNNGHFRTYHPFNVDRSITQEEADKIMNKNGIVGRHGVNIEQFLNMLSDEGCMVSLHTCKCCRTVLHEITKPNLPKWETIEGVMGNY